jgi:hypothetical protein
MTLKEFKAYFKTLPMDRIGQLLQAYEVLKADPEIYREFGAGILDMSYCLQVAQTEKKTGKESKIG